jgi:phosphoribosyl-AMP cyclohydrolase
MVSPDCSLDFSRPDGLVAAIAVDADNGQVLMLAWMNEEAFRLTLETGDVCYFSRSRGKLWKKGESSGNVQKLVEMRVDCDADAVLLRVRQTGPACHEGYRSCFFRTVAPDGSLKIDAERLMSPEEMYGVKR